MNTEKLKERVEKIRIDIKNLYAQRANLSKQLELTNNKIRELIGANNELVGLLKEVEEDEKKNNESENPEEK